MNCKNVYIFPQGTIDPELLLEKAKEWNMDTFIIFGMAGDEFVAGSNTQDSKTLAHLGLLGQKRLGEILDNEFDYYTDKLL